MHLAAEWGRSGEEGGEEEGVCLFPRLSVDRSEHLNKYPQKYIFCLFYVSVHTHAALIGC